MRRSILVSQCTQGDGCYTEATEQMRRQCSASSSANPQRTPDASWSVTLENSSYFYCRVAKWGGRQQCEEGGQVLGWVLVGLSVKTCGEGGRSGGAIGVIVEDAPYMGGHIFRQRRVDRETLPGSSTFRGEHDGWGGRVPQSMQGKGQAQRCVGRWQQAAVGLVCY